METGRFDPPGGCRPVPAGGDRLGRVGQPVQNGCLAGSVVRRPLHFLPARSPEFPVEIRPAAADGQPGHHWVPALERKTSVPDYIKNQPIFIKGMKDNVQHGRVHGPYTDKGVKLPQFTPVERIIHGTPDWVKAGYVSTAGHGGTAAGRAKKDKR